MRQEPRQLIIDDAGKWWLWPSAVLDERFDYPEPDFDLWSYTVRNLGYVAVVLEEGCTFVQYRPALAKPAAVASLVSYLERYGDRGPVFLLYYLGGWTEEARRNGHAAASRIREIGAAAAMERRREPFLIAPKAFDTLFTGKRHRLADVADLWRQSEHRFDSNIKAQLKKLRLLERTIIVAVAPNRDQLLVRYCGSGFGHYDAATHNRLVGRSVEQQPDRNYGEWVALTYKNVAVTQSPQFADVDAVIQHPAHDIRRSRYQRLILPWTGRRVTFLTSTSLLQPDIDIPLGG